jgi:hypothetical protein
MGLRLQYYGLHHPEVFLRYVIFLDYHFFEFCNDPTHGLQSLEVWMTRIVFFCDTMLQKWAVG